MRQQKLLPVCLLDRWFLAVWTWALSRSLFCVDRAHLQQVQGEIPVKRTWAEDTLFRACDSVRCTVAEVRNEPRGGARVLAVVQDRHEAAMTDVEEGSDSGGYGDTEVRDEQAAAGQGTSPSLQWLAWLDRQHAAAAAAAAGSAVGAVPSARRRDGGRRYGRVRLTPAERRPGARIWLSQALAERLGHGRRWPLAVGTELALFTLPDGSPVWMFPAVPLG